MTDRVWYFAIGSNRQGPVPWDELKGRAASGEIKSDTLVWTPTMTEWTKAGAVPDLFPAGTPPSIPAVQPPPVALTKSRSEVSGDARAMMLFESNKKSMLASYLLWFFLGGFGGHRFYNGRSGSAASQLVLSILGLLTVALYGLGFLFLVPVWIWVIVDAFLIPSWVRNHNSLLAAQLT